MKTKVIVGCIFFFMAALIYKLITITLILLHASPVTLPPNNLYIHYNKAESGHIQAEGTWFIKGQEQAFPLQFSTIECHGETKSCSGATAIVMGGDMLHVFLDSFKILEWSDTHVSFVDSSSFCVDYLYEIDLIQEKVTGIRKKKNSTQSCSGMDATLYMELRNGIDAGSSYVKNKEGNLWKDIKSIIFLLKDF